MTINFDELVRFTQSLVQVRTLPGEEKPAVALVAAEMRRLGYDDIVTDANGSLVGLIEGEQAGPMLLLDAHCDTVGIAEGVEWQYDPFGAEVVGERMMGRGTSDMKGALAAMIHAAAAVDRSKLAGRVAVSATVMEEVMEGVALKAIMDIVQPNLVVIGESTNLNLNHGGRGRAEIHLEAIGKPSHSSTPHLGVNAVHLMLKAVQAIETLPLPHDPLLGDGLLALTDIISDPYPGHSVIPSRCRVTYDRRLLAGETIDSVLGPITNLPEMASINAIIATGEHTTYTGSTLYGPKFFPAWKLPADHALVQSALAGLHDAGLPSELGTYQFCTNAAHSAGHAQVPTIGFGPSTEGQAHQVDEYILLEHLQAAARGYQGIIEGVLS
ncbi:MAG: YgeY family selenium metabolism-linked hydrolase [Anaerolineae bacterium]|nr:YgeY family selenium metabolism-linked hydrolase [Anaerolineae bacterium]